MYYYSLSDPSNTNDSEVLSVNEFADTLPKPRCVYPNFTHGTSAMYRYGYGIRADDEDAFLMHSLKPRSMLLVARLATHVRLLAMVAYTST